MVMIFCPSVTGCFFLLAPIVYSRLKDMVIDYFRGSPPTSVHTVIRDADIEIVVDKSLIDHKPEF